MQNHLYCLPEKAKPHQGESNTEAIPPDAARAWGERVKTTEQSLLSDSELKGNHDAQRLAH